jgi:hypothetical protein
VRLHQDLKEIDGVLRTSWVMVFVFWVGWVAGDWVALTLFGFVSFFALREFLTLSPTRRGDHRSLVLAFFVVLPLQYWLVGSEHFDMFAVFIPVYCICVCIHRLRGGVAGAFGHEGTQARPRHPELGGAHQVRHRCGRLAGPGGCLVLCCTRIFPLRQVVFQPLAPVDTAQAATKTIA